MTLVRILLIGGVAGCKASTTRPTFVPYPESAYGEIGLSQPDRDSSVVKVTRLVVEALKADSIPLARVHEFDGFFDSGWIDAKTLEPTRRRPLGPEVVRVRGWVDPSKPGFNEVSLETVYVPLADPSRPARELEIPAPADHPVAKRIADLMKQLVEKYGDPAAREQVKKAPGGPPIPGAQPARDTSKAGRRPPASDTTASPAPAVKRDTTVKRDTVDLT